MDQGDNENTHFIEVSTYITRHYEFKYWFNIKFVQLIILIYLS